MSSQEDVAATALRTLTDENTALLGRMAADAETVASLAAARALLGGAPRVFVLGAGRSGLALTMVAMRLMHLGLRVHVVGEATAPAIAEGDVLLVASGSGTTGGVLRAAQTASSVGARILAITTAPTSPLADVADVVVVIPAAAKQDHAHTLSVQYSGGLFEQALLVVGDSLFHALWLESGLTAEELWPRHANIE